MRIDTKNENAREDLVCRRKIQKDKDYVLLTKNLWTFISGCFGVDYTISRDKDGIRTSLFQVNYLIHHDDNLKLLILPPVDQITEESLAEIGKPIKIYYNTKTTF